MITREQLQHTLADLLSISTLRDYCPNGLQVEGKHDIRTIVTGVTASLALIEAAILHRADAILVHHGYFWRSEAPVITGSKRARIAALLAHDINLFAYHLPLDVHSELGNNAMLAKQLGITITATHAVDGIPDLLWEGELPQAQDPHVFTQHISHQLAREPLFIQAGDHPISTIAWCTGAAQGSIEQARALPVDAYISGEISESTVHFARENAIHYFAAGHHATERYGIQALGELLADEYQLEHHFIDIPNPV